MATENGPHYKTTEELFCANVHIPHHNIFLAALNIFLSMGAFLGNVLILIALHKESSLHPPPKLMFRCLAITDLLVGLTSQPMFAAELISDLKEQQRLCNYFKMVSDITAVVCSGVSLLTVTAVSVDRLLALSMGLRYRQVVTRRRVGSILCWFWCVCVAIVVMRRFRFAIIYSVVSSTMIILCIITSVYCYTKIFLILRHHQVQILGQGQPNGGGGIILNIARYRKTVSAALWVQIALVACYLPFALIRPLESLFSLSKVSHILGRRYTVSLVYLNSNLNPFLYCWKIREVRQAVKDTVNQYCCMTS